MVLCYRCGCYGHIAPHCESERRRRSDEFYYDSPGSWSDQESDDSSESSESDEWDEREEPVISDSINSAGVYVIVLDDGTRYVGKSANVNRRIFQHLTKIKMVGLCVLWKSAMKEKDTLIVRISSLPKVRIGRRSGK